MAMADRKQKQDVKGSNSSVDWESSYEASSEPVAIYGSDSRLKFANRAFHERAERIGVKIENGMTQQECLRKIADGFPILKTPEERQAFVDQQNDYFESCLKTGEPIDFKRHDDTYCRITVRRSRAGDIIYTQADITDQVRQKNDLRSILENSDQGIIVKDRHDVLQFMNDSYREIMELEGFELAPGVTSRDMWAYLREHSSFAEIYTSDEEWEAFHKYVSDTIKRATDEPLDFVLGDNRHVKIFVRESDDGRTLIFVSDVTELRQKQVELEAETLKAQAAEKAKSEFLANMSHEIRTPMNGVMGMAELLMNTELNPRQHSFADTIVKSGEALLTIINDILDFSKIDAGQIELIPAPFDLREAIEDVVTLIAPRVAAKDVELAVRVFPGLPDMYVGDVGRIRQIITNLVGNAVKFTDAGHVIVDVLGELSNSGETPEAQLVIRVEDTGIGIPEDNLSTVFEKFSQVDTTAARRHEGTGLGLAITSSLIELMNGEVEVESEVGVGTVFKLKLSLPVHGDSRRKRHAPVDINNARLLVVDDNAVNRSILLEQTAAWGFQTKAASSGAQALGLLEAALVLDEPFELAIFDYHMPEMTGAELLQAVRGDERFADLPVVMLTSVDQTEDGKLFASLGIQAHLTKPARSSLLMETLISTLQEARGDELLDDESEIQSSIEKNLGVLRDSVAAGKTPGARSPNVGRKEQKTEEDSEDCDIDVLVAEDNAVNQVVFTQTLEELGYSFRIAENGREAIEFYKRFHPKLILMDISMPEVNGLEATSAIRELEKNAVAQTPIIAVTAHAMSGDREKYLDNGMDDYVSKPISPARLADMIKKWERSDTKVA